MLEKEMQDMSSHQLCSMRRHQIWNLWHQTIVHLHFKEHTLCCDMLQMQQSLHRWNQTPPWWQIRRTSSLFQHEQPLHTHHRPLQWDPHVPSDLRVIGLLHTPGPDSQRFRKEQNTTVKYSTLAGPRNWNPRPVGFRLGISDLVSPLPYVVPCSPFSCFLFPSVFFFLLVLSFNLAFQLSRESVYGAPCVLASQVAFFAACLRPRFYTRFIYFPTSQTLSREHYSDEGLLSETLVNICIIKHRRDAPYLVRHYFHILLLWDVTWNFLYFSSSNNKPHLPCKQSASEDHHPKNENEVSVRDLRWTSRFSRRKRDHRPKLWTSEMSSKCVGNTNILSICAL